MHRFTLTTFLCLCFSLVQAQGFLILGAPQLDDQGNRMIVTQDGGYITVGNTGGNAVIYRTDCLGNLVVKLEKQLPDEISFLNDVVELSDGNLLAVGRSINTGSPAFSRAFALKVTPMLTEIASNSFFVANSSAEVKSLAQSGVGEALLWGQIDGTAPNYLDAFVQKIDLNTLQPIGDATVFDDGVDFAARMLPTVDGNYLLAGSSLAGDVFNPNVLLGNAIQAYKVDKNGVLLWHTALRDTFLAQYGYARACGVVQSYQSGNFLLGGNFFKSPANKQDAFFLLLDNNGVVLDTAFSDAPENQQGRAIVENLAYPGFYAIIGETEGSPLNAPAYMLTQAYETGGQIYSGPAALDLNNPVSLRDAAQVDPGRFALMGTYPEAPGQAGSPTSIVISTPSVTAGIVYQNCALAVTLTGTGAAFQWVREGVAIPGATQGVYFPTEPGLYQVQVIDSKGCYGISDTFRVNAAHADFTYVLDNLSATFSNTSANATMYHWDFGDGSTSTQANPAHTYAADGVYTVTLIAKTACQGNFSDTISLQVGVVATAEPSGVRYSLAPNPSPGVSTLDAYFQSGQTAQLLITSPLGQIIAQEILPLQNGRLFKQIDLSSLPAGVYPIRISNGEEVILEKLLKF